MSKKIESDMTCGFTNEPMHGYQTGNFVGGDFALSVTIPIDVFGKVFEVSKKFRVVLEEIE